MDNRLQTEDRRLKTGDRKGQIAMEGLTAITVVMAVFAMLVVVWLDRDSALVDRGEFMDKRDACIAIQSAVSSVLAAGEGADYTFNSTYKDTIFVSGRYVEAGVENAFACVLPVEVETATLGSGEIIVRNYNNSITIENV